MSYLDGMLANHFPDYELLNKTNRSTVLQTVLLFMFRGLDTKGMNKVFTEHLIGDKKNFRLQLNGNGYTFKIKAFIYYCVTKGVQRGKRLEKIRRMFGVKTEDLSLLKYANRNKKLSALLRRYINRLRYSAFTLRSFRALISEQYEDLKAYAMRYVRKKMDFGLMKSIKDDITHDLLAQGMQAAMVMYPCYKCKLHAINIIKQCIHNTGVNIIEWHTTKGRATLIRNKDGTFSSNKVSLDALVAEGRTLSPGATDSYGNQILGMPARAQESVENKLSVDQVLSSVSGRRKRFLLLLQGAVDKKFTRWLHEEKRIDRGLDNEDHYEKLLSNGQQDVYISQASEFVGLTKVKTDRLFQSLRASLGAV